MRRNELGGTVFYQSQFIQIFPDIRHGVTTRHGGISPAPFDTLNLSAHVGDDPANVRENLERMHRALNLEASATVDAKQAQSNRVAVIDRSQRGTRVQDVDALITNVRGLPLMLRFADCVPIFFYDPKRRVIAVAHAGWRGTISRVVTNTVKTLQETFGSQPQDLIACVGPSIGPCCYEVGVDVQARARESFPSHDGFLERHNGSIHLNLWAANAQQLRELGVEQIEVSGVCTSDHTEDFYSWRREHAQTGRFAAIISLAG